MIACRPCTNWRRTWRMYLGCYASESIAATQTNCLVKIGDGVGLSQCEFGFVA